MSDAVKNWQQPKRPLQARCSNCGNRWDLIHGPLPLHEAIAKLRHAKCDHCRTGPSNIQVAVHE